jgi:hypothetical protein
VPAFTFATSSYDNRHSSINNDSTIGGKPKKRELNKTKKMIRDERKKESDRIKKKKT